MKVFRRSVTAVSILTVAAILAIDGKAKASILMTIDATNPSNAIIKATAGLSAASDSHFSYAILLTGTGIPSSQYGDYEPGGSFGPAAGGTYNSIGTGNTGDIILNGGGNLDQIFTAGQVAFTGQTTADLSFLTFPSSSVTGNIDILNNTDGDTGIVIGQYAINVPEPAMLGLLAVGGLITLRRRSRLARCE